MPDWTQPAREEVRRYFTRVRASLAESGADVSGATAWFGTSIRCDTTNLYLCVFGKAIQVLVRQQTHRTHDSQLHDGGRTSEIIERACHILVSVREQLVGSDIPIMRGPFASLQARSQFIKDTCTVTLQELAVQAFETTPIRFWNMRGHGR